MTEDWTATLPARERLDILRPGAPTALATGPATISGLDIRIAASHLKDLQVRVGGQPPVPASFFFGLASTGTVADGGWSTFRSALHAAWTPDAAGRGRLATRLPIPLGQGEALSLEAAPGGAIDGLEASLHLAPAHPGVRLIAQYRDQRARGRETTMPLFESDEPLQLVALFEQLSDGRPNDRTYLEGDEMVRTDGMSYPLQLGTGTEDYFNGGFFFLGPRNKPLGGLLRFLVIDPENGWRNARFVESLYRLHVADPIVSRSGMRFGFEAGPTGAYAPLRVRSLGLAYAFSGHRMLGKQKVNLARTRRERSAVDAERGARRSFPFARAAASPGLTSSALRPTRGRCCSCARTRRRRARKRRASVSTGARSGSCTRPRRTQPDRSPRTRSGSSSTPLDAQRGNGPSWRSTPRTPPRRGARAATRCVSSPGRPPRA